MARRLDHPRRRRHQRVARLHPGGQGGEGAGFDPQHAFRRGPDPARRRDPPHPGRGTGARRHRAARVGRPDPRGPSPRRREEPADGRGGAHGRVGADRQDHRCRGREVDGRGPEGMAFSGTLVVSGRGTGVVVATGARHRARPHQPDDGGGQRARDAAAASDQEVRIHDQRA